MAVLDIVVLLMLVFLQPLAMLVLPKVVGHGNFPPNLSNTSITHSSFNHATFRHGSFSYRQPWSFKTC